MTLAMKRMKNVGWLALVFIIAIMLYPLSLNVASVHSDLARVDEKIRDTKREINFLEAELATRANIAQLDEWNQLLYGYEPPSADQFLEGERALASLNGAAPIIRPVMVSVAGPEGIIPAGEIGKVGTAASNIDAAKETAQPSSGTQVALRSSPKEHSEASDLPVKAVASVPPTRTERLAKIDAQLLSDSMLKDIQKRAKEEQKRQ
jgi:hypothetical protein